LELCDQFNLILSLLKYFLFVTKLEHQISIRTMSEGSCDAEDWVMMLKAQSHPKRSYDRQHPPF